MGRHKILIYINVIFIALIIVFIYIDNEKFWDNKFALLALVLSLINILINYDKSKNN